MAYSDVAVANDNTNGPAGAASQPSSYSAVDLAQKRRWFRAYETNKGRELKEQRLHRRYYHTKQWSDEEVQKLNRRNQPIVTANRIQRKVDFLVGVEQRMRRDPKAYPRNPQDEQSADVATAAIRYVMDWNRWDQLASIGAHDGLVNGIGVIFCGIEQKRTGLEPVLKIVSGERFFYDPRSEKADFSDARFMGVSLWLDVDDAKEQFPDKADQLGKYMERDGGLSTFSVESDRDQQWGDFEQQRVRVVEIWWKGTIKSGLMNSSSLVPVQNINVFGWQFCKFCGDVDLESGPSPYVDEDGTPDNPYIAWTCYIDEQGDRYGVIRSMRSIQDEINYRRSKFLHLLSVRQVFTRKGDVEDIDDFRTQLAKADGVVEHNGEWGKTTGIIDMTTEIRGQAELLAEAKSELENLGPNPGLIGKGEGVDGASGRALLAQRDSGMTELSPVFDRLRDWKLRVYRKAWLRTKQAWTAEKWIRVTDNPEAPQFIGLNVYSQDPMTGQIQAENQMAEIDVDIIMEEGPDTVIMQEELMQTLANLGEAAAGPLGKVMIEMSNVPNKDRLLKSLEEATTPPPNPMQEQAQKLELAGKQAQVENIHADTQKKLADAGSSGMNGGPDPVDPVERMLTLEHQQAETEKVRAQTAEVGSKIQTNRATAYKAVTDANLAREQPKLISEYGGPRGER